MGEVTRLKTMVRGDLDWHNLTTSFHKNLPFGSKVDTETGTQTER
jgi:hypothetical protein